MQNRTFADHEREGWQRNAADYEAVVLEATSQAFAPLLDSLGALRGKRVLELASGTGHLAEQALARGAAVTGIDVATNMVELARKRAPGAKFQTGDAEALPFGDGEFDAVVCTFGLLHFAEPLKAMREAARVLKPGGSFAFTVWCAPDRSPFFKSILDVYQAHAKMDVGLPPAPPMFALADPALRDPMLRQAGFGEVSARELPVAWPLHGPETLTSFVLKGAVRNRMLYELQTPQVQAKIREALTEATLRVIRGGAKAIPGPAMLVSARKA